MPRRLRRPFPLWPHRGEEAPGGELHWPSRSCPPSPSPRSPPVRGTPRPRPTPQRRPRRPPLPLPGGPSRSTLGRSRGARWLTGGRDQGEPEHDGQSRLCESGCGTACAQALGRHGSAPAVEAAPASNAGTAGTGRAGPLRAGYRPGDDFAPGAKARASTLAITCRNVRRSCPRTPPDAERRSTRWAAATR